VNFPALKTLLLAGLTLAGAQLFADGNNPSLDNDRAARMAWWREARFGMFIHYGPVSLTGKELSWSRANSNTNCPNHGETPVAVYDNLYKSFNPTNFNAAEWADIAKSAGMKYVVLTAKHCDGFLLWDSKVDTYNIGATPFHRDLCGELAQAVRAAGLHMGWYFSPMDWRDPECRSTNNDHFVTHIQEEIRELLSNYGQIDVLWFDSDGRPTMWHPETTYPLVKNLQPQIIIDNRLQLDTGEQWAHQEKLKLRTNEDFYTPEQHIGAYDDQQPWESCMTFGTQWSWKPDDKIKPAAEVVNILAQTVGGDGNLLLDAGPMPDGRIEPRQVEVLKKVGAWMQTNGESIYGTRGGPWKPTKQIASTRRGNSAYVFVLNRNHTTVELPSLPRKIISANVLGGGLVDMEMAGGKIVLHLQPRKAWTATVVKLQLEGSVMDVPAISLPESTEASASETNSLPLTGVTFFTTDTNLQKLYNRAETMERRNVVQFTPTMKTLVEGGGYGNCWIETQPMGGEMYAARNVELALNNQLVFLLTQRPDGRFPGMVSSMLHATNLDQFQSTHDHGWFHNLRIMANYNFFQGLCFPEPAWRTYFWIGKDKAYLEKLYDGLAAHDAYLWRTRDSNHDGILETWCIYDNGEDFAERLMARGAPTRWPFEVPPGSPGTPDPSNPKDFRSYWALHADRKIKPFPLDKVLVPFQSMDTMAYSYDMRATLAKISRELGNGKETFWREQAEQVRQKLTEKLWDEKRHACFDHDKNGKQLPEVIHNNLRAMYHGIFSQKMADEFIKYHLLNTNEFWTKVPLPSIAVNDPLFRNATGNDWSGQAEGLTYQRAIRALENYGHYSLVTELGEKLIAAVEGGNNRFTEQFNPLTGEPGCPGQDGYGPMILSVLEYMSRMHGIHLDVANSQIWWSACDGEDFSTSQRWGEHKWTLTSTNDVMTASLDGKNLFTCSAGCRVVTDLDGKVSAIIGITSEEQKITLAANGQKHRLSVKPDQNIALKF
jgi:alpha-L-fucosidase